MIIVIMHEKKNNAKRKLMRRKPMQITRNIDNDVIGKRRHVISAKLLSETIAGIPVKG